MVAAAVLALGVPAPAHASGASDRLVTADRLRSQDARRFRSMLAELERERLSRAEREHLRLLQDYRDTIDGRYERAIADAIRLYDETTQPTLKYRAALLVANAAAIKRDFSVSLRYLEHALEIPDEVVSAEFKALAPLVASTVYNEYGQYALAQRYVRQVLASEAAPRTRCIARQNLVEAKFRTGMAIDEEADVYSAVTFCADLGEMIPASFIRTTLARHWAATGRKRQAIALLRLSVQDAKNTGYARLIGEVNSLLAQYERDVGDIAGAEAHARFVTSMKGLDPHWTPAITSHRVLYQINLARGDFRAALDEYRAYSEAERARLDDVQAREYAFQLSRQELNQKNQSIMLLQSQNRLLQLKQQAATAAAWNTRLAIALLLVLVASLGFWGWRARRMHGSLRTLAETDGLTGLANRRHFRATSEAVLAQCAQRQRPVTVLLFDLDHFKQINDQCGHSAGDWVLREVARVGGLQCREGDVFGRIGGEEFAMTLVDAELHEALGIAEACRCAIAAIDADAAGCCLPVTASIGVVGTRQVGYDYEALIAHADAAMYRSKVGGRNRVTLYEPPAVPEPGQPSVLDRRSADSKLRHY